MARIRSAKPDFWTDPLMSSLSRDIRFTFKGLWEVCADDFGRFLANSRVIKGKIWPTDDDLSPRKLESFLETLASCGRIILYSHDGVRYGYIVNWLKHQRVSHPSESIFPPPPPESFANHAGNSREPLARTSALSGAERSGAGLGVGVREGSGAESASPEESRNFSAPRNGSNGAKSIADFEPPDSEPFCDDIDPLTREYDRATDRAAPPAPRVALPTDAERLVEQLYSLATEKRRLDVRRQLYDALDPIGKGARLRRGTFVKARSAEHLAVCCRAVMEDPPRNVDAAIVIVLEKLQDPPAGPTPSELHKAREDAERADEDAYQRAAKAAGVRWAKEHPEAYDPIRLEVDATFSANTGAFGAVAKESALTQRCARAAGFPDFATWRAERRNGGREFASTSSSARS